MPAARVVRTFALSLLIALPGGAETLVLGELVLAPGLIDTHTLCLSQTHPPVE